MAESSLIGKEFEKSSEVSVNPIGLKKNYGVELLRILSMLFVIILHVINFGGISYYCVQANPGEAVLLPHYKTMNIMLAVCYCAVNCYALISGYVSCKSKFKPSRLVSLWLTVVSINAAMYVFAYIYNPEWVAGYELKRIFMPLTTEQSWYFTAYIGLMVIMPALNAAVNNIPKKQYGYMLVLMLVFFSLLPSYSNRDLFKTGTGYSMLWLVFMYIVGAYFRLHFNTEKKIPFLKTVCVAVFVLSALLMSFIRFGKEVSLLEAGAGYTLYANDYLYTSPYIVVCSVALFVLFINIRIKNNFLGKAIGFVSSTTFGIYLIHLNSIVLNNTIAGRLGSLTLKTPIGMAFGIVVASAGIFVMCAAVEKVRQLLFKVLFVDKLVSLIDKINLTEKE